MQEKECLFNPFNIKNKTSKDLKEMYSNVFQQLLEEPNTMYEYAHNLEVYSNLNYIIGEVIARLNKDVIELKTQIKIDTAIHTTEERKLWSDGKPPAMSYFEALATRMCQESINMLADKECSLTRFKNAYKSTEEKINAIKKKMEAVRFEEFNN